MRFRTVIKGTADFILRIISVSLFLLVYRCPIRLVFNLDCPGCGLTRACVSALKLDFVSAFNYHPLFWLIGPEFIYALFSDYVKKIIKVDDRAENTVVAVSVLLLLIVWIFKQFKIL